jgi:hypothetical protein
MWCLQCCQFVDAALVVSLLLPALLPAAPAPPGHPKGVRLSHGNLAYQVQHLDYFLQVRAVAWPRGK